MLTSQAASLMALSSVCTLNCPCQPNQTLTPAHCVNMCLGSISSHMYSHSTILQTALGVAALHDGVQCELLLLVLPCLNSCNIRSNPITWCCRCCHGDEGLGPSHGFCLRAFILCQALQDLQCCCVCLLLGFFQDLAPLDSKLWPICIP